MTDSVRISARRSRSGQKSLAARAHVLTPIRLELAGIPRDVTTISVPVSHGRTARVTSAATVAETKQEPDRLALTLEYPRGEMSHTIIGGIGRPNAVTSDGAPLPEVDDLDSVEQGWQLLADLNLLLIKVPHGNSAARVTIVFDATST